MSENLYFLFFSKVLQESGNAILVALQPDEDVDHQTYANLPGFEVYSMKTIEDGTALFRKEFPGIGMVITNFNSGIWKENTIWREQPMWHVQDWICRNFKWARERNPNYSLIILSEGLPDPVIFTHMRMPFRSSGIFNNKSFWQLTPRGELCQCRIMILRSPPRRLVWRVTS